MSVSFAERRLSDAVTVARCPCCGETARSREPVLWKELIDEWRLSPQEAELVDRREGVRRTRSGSNLRSMALAWSILNASQGTGTLDEFMASPRAALRILEVTHAR